MAADYQRLYRRLTGRAEPRSERRRITNPATAAGSRQPPRPARQPSLRSTVVCWRASVAARALQGNVANGANQ